MTTAENYYRKSLSLVGVSGFMFNVKQVSVEDILVNFVHKKGSAIWKELSTHKCLNSKCKSCHESLLAVHSNKTDFYLYKNISEQYLNSSKSVIHQFEGES